MKNNSPSEESIAEKRKRIRARLERESKLVSAESMKMNKILEEIADGDDQI